jgi:glutathione synthase/RimK-type ligase-like ATP-grasp enzyme
MQDGEYIVDRWIVGVLREICKARGISFQAYSDDWLLELRKDRIVSRVLGYRFSLNDSVASSIAQDKVATYQTLEKAGLPAVPHVLVRTKVSQADQQVISVWRRIVIKPLVGTSGHGVGLFDDTNEAIRYIEKSAITAWAAAPYVDIKREVRVIMLDGNPLLTYEKQPVTIRGLKMFNLGLGAIPKDIEISQDLLELAIRAQQELGLRLSTVDIIENQEGKYRMLEINDSIMMEHYMRQSPVHKERGREVYEKIVEVMFE